METQATFILSASMLFISAIAVIVIYRGVKDIVNNLIKYYINKRNNKDM